MVGAWRAGGCHWRQSVGSPGDFGEARWRSTPVTTADLHALMEKGLLWLRGDTARWDVHYAFFARNVGQVERPGWARRTCTCLRLTMLQASALEAALETASGDDRQGPGANLGLCLGCGMSVAIRTSPSVVGGAAIVSLLVMYRVVRIIRFCTSSQDSATYLDISSAAW